MGGSKGQRRRAVLELEGLYRARRGLRAVLGELLLSRAPAQEGLSPQVCLEYRRSLHGG
jgi:hypothetical protein